MNQPNNINQTLRDARRKLGYTCEELGKMIGVSGSTIQNYETLRCYPADDNAVGLSQVLGVHPDELFPEWIKYMTEDVTKNPDNVVSMSYLPRRTVDPTARMEDSVLRENRAYWFRQVLSEIGDRERRVVELRYGFEDGKERTLEEVANVMNLSRERIRQLEGEALERFVRVAMRMEMPEFQTAVTK